MDKILNDIRRELKKNADAKTRASGRNFFKEEINLYGVKTPVVSKIAKAFFPRVKERGKKGIFALCEELWRSGYMEESFVACGWSYALRREFAPADFKVFEKWVKTYVSNWASCDTFTNHTVGSFLEMYPEFLPELKKWAKSKNRWTRRAAATSLIVPARKGKFLKEVFGISDIMFKDEDDLVLKGYGWALKVASQAHEAEVFAYVMKRKAEMPRTALRYAIEKMPPDLRQKAMMR